MKTNALAMLSRDLPGLFVLAAIALAAGVLVNQFREQPLPLISLSKAARLEKAVAKVEAATPTVPASPTPPAAAAEVREIDLAEFRRLLAEPQALAVDARPEIFHRLGHVPGALALPRDDFETYYQKHRTKLEGYKNQLLLIYCQTSTCEDSHLVSNALTRLGYTQLAIFTGGWNQWTQQRLAEEK